MRITSLLSITLLAAPVMAFAQEGEDAPGEDMPVAEAADGEAAPEAAVASAPPPAETSVDTFKIRRGLHAELDLGVFFTFGGINNNADTFLTYNPADPTNPATGALPTKTLSNVQPLLALFFGYDIVQDPKYAFAAGLRLAAAYSGGASRLKQADVDATAPLSTERRVLATRANDYGVIQTGVGLAFSYLMTERIALSVKANGGLAIVDPDPVATAGEASGGSSAFSGVVGGGLGVEYFTLLNDFSVGLDVQFVMVFAAGGIPSLGASIPIKYTF